MDTSGKWRSWPVYVLHLTAAVIILLPLAFVLISSFRSLDNIFKYISPVTLRTFLPVETTVEAYIQLFTEREFGRALFNTFYTAILQVLGGVVIGSMAAFAFVFFSFRGKALLFSIVLIAFMIPFEVTAIPLYDLVQRLGWIDSYTGIVVPGLANGLVIFLFRQFFLDLPPSMDEAARIDGAGPLRIYAGIIMPLCKPVTVSAALMIFVHQWESFMWPLLATRSKEYKVIQVALSDFTTEFGTYWNELFAASMISMIIPVLVLLPLQRFFVMGVTSSGLKE
ncbi:MAG: transporter permease [Paenibacillaceae bacterium]|jgi:multiple sugar transport system permease protein/putative chitobiose transport system permease protein|nr:transporter permease [Paenibacillaceae bacterium]